MASKKSATRSSLPTSSSKSDMFQPCRAFWDRLCSFSQASKGEVFFFSSYLPAPHLRHSSLQEKFTSSHSCVEQSQSPFSSNLKPGFFDPHLWHDLRRRKLLKPHSGAGQIQSCGAKMMPSSSSSSRMRSAVAKSFFAQALCQLLISFSCAGVRVCFWLNHLKAPTPTTRAGAETETRAHARGIVRCTLLRNITPAVVRTVSMSGGIVRGGGSLWKGQQLLLIEIRTQVKPSAANTDTLRAWPGQTAEVAPPPPRTQCRRQSL